MIIIGNAFLYLLYFGTIYLCYSIGLKDGCIPKSLIDYFKFIGFALFVSFWIPTLVFMFIGIDEIDSIAALFIACFLACIYGQYKKRLKNNIKEV